jgi:hypothetical protein
MADFIRFYNAALSPMEYLHQLGKKGGRGDIFKTKTKGERQFQAQGEGPKAKGENRRDRP